MTSIKNSGFSIFSLFLALSILAFPPSIYAKKEEKKKVSNVFAIMNTTEGKIKIQLFEDKAPKTVQNFVSLAEGTNTNSGLNSKYKGKKFYDGLTFHRIIPQFMIQGGCPEGTGRGGPGYTFEDETNTDLTHKPFVLSMANAGPNTNGSQFFITTVATPWLNGKHTVFGEVVEGKDVVQKIEALGTQSGAPSKPVKIDSVVIERN